MDINRKVRRQLQLQHWVFVLLLVALAVLLGMLARTYHKSWDVTLNARNSLSPGSAELLKKLKQPIHITAYTAPDSEAARALTDFITPYQRAKRDIKLDYINPAEQPQLARQAGVQREGELVVRLGQRSEHLVAYNESALSNLLMRLARDQERTVLYLDGHGERKLDGEANFDLGDFGQQLAARGFRSAPLNLVAVPDVPHNTAVLVISQPRVDLLPVEIDKLKQYVKRGGSVLWLLDPEPLHGLQALVEQFGLALTPGTVVDPKAQEFKASPAMAVANAYGRHAVTEHFDILTIFPFAREIEALENDQGWRVTPLVQVAPRGWLESGKVDTDVRYDKKQDKAGPINIGIALERMVENRAQRVAVIGSGAFLSNQYLGIRGNLDLGLNLVNWLAGDDNLITIQPRATRDAQPQFTATSQGIIVFGFLIILPLALLGMGGWIWWRRRKP